VVIGFFVELHFHKPHWGI